MKTYPIAILLLLSLNLSAQCPDGGDNARLKLMHLDSLKNRHLPATEAVPMTVADFLTSQPDADAWSDSTYVALTGYIVGAKWGGAETCNCHSQDKDDDDIHIEVAATADETSKTLMMVCEMSRFTRDGMSLRDVKRLKGQRVTLTGWLFYDSEHWQNAINSNPTGTTLWRGTAWEVHPVFTITPAP